MQGAPAAVDKAREHILALYARAQEAGLELFRPSMEAASKSVPGFRSTKSSRLRKALKATMHSLGLGLRHGRLLAEAAATQGDDKLHAAICVALAQPHRTDSLCGQAVLQMARRLAVLIDADEHGFKREMCETVAMEVRCFAAKGVRLDGMDSIHLSPLMTGEDGTDHLPEPEREESVCVGTQLAAASD